MSIDIVPVQSKRDLKDFIHLPWDIYPDYPCWVPPLIREVKTALNPKVNPFFEHAEVKLFLAKAHGQVVGRVAAIDNRQYREAYNEPLGFFGYFESIRDHEVAKCLLLEASDWLKQRGLKTVRGPVTFSTVDELGLLVDGFDEPPVVMMPYNPQYYSDLLEGVGFKKVKDLWAYQVTQVESSGKLKNLLQWLGAINKKEGLTIRKANLKEFNKEIALMRKMYNSAWEKNWGFIPVTDNEFQHIAQKLRKVLDPDLAYIAEINQEPVGFVVAIPDFNQVLRKINGWLHPIALLKILWGSRHIDGLRFLAQGVKASYRDSGIAALLLYELFQASQKKGYKKAEISWILEDNTKVNFILGKAGLKVRKKYRLYDLPLTT